MKNEVIISGINSALRQTTIHISAWLNKMLRQVSKDWWQECVLDKLSYNQRMIAVENNITKLEEFDLAALLRIADRNWYVMRDFAYLPTVERECLHNMMSVRNNWAHCSGTLPDNELIKKDIFTIIEFLEQRNGPKNAIDALKALLAHIDELENTQPPSGPSFDEMVVTQGSQEIKEKSVVKLVSQPDVKGVVISIENIGEIISTMCFLIVG